MRENLDGWGEKRVPGWDRASGRAIEQGQKAPVRASEQGKTAQQNHPAKPQGRSTWQGLAGGVVFAEAVDGGFDKAGGANAGGGEKGRQDIPAGKGETANDANGVGRHVVTQ